MNHIIKVLAVSALMALSMAASAQRYQGVINKTVAVVGNEVITLSDLEQEVRVAGMQGAASDRTMRCNLLESMMTSYLFLSQARVDSLEVNAANVEMALSQRIDQIRTSLGGDQQVEDYFGMPLYKLRQEWSNQLRNQSLIQQEQQDIASKVPEMTPLDVRNYLDTVDHQDLPIVPEKYQLSQICLYPDREAANAAVKERLLSIRERILNGESFATLARLYSEDPGSARRGGELGMASKSIFWPAFSDAAMALRPGLISQIVETPDGFHLIEVLEKSGDMFNARHILLKPQYTTDDQQKAFATLDSIRTEILNDAITFSLAAQFYSQDAPTRTNGGQMADPNTGSSYFEIDQLKPQDYVAIQDLKEGEISRPIASLDNEGRDGNLVYKIIRVDKILPAHTATYENDFGSLAEEIRAIKQGEKLDEFVDQKILSTHIVIDPMFKDCVFERPGWSLKFSEE